MTRELIEKKKRELDAKIAERNGGTIIGCYKVMTDAEKQEETELNYRGMIHSCLAYLSNYQIRDDRTGKWGRYGMEYVKKLGVERATEIWEEERDFFKAHAKIVKNVHTDYEGVSYNSVVWDEYALSLAE